MFKFLYTFCVILLCQFFSLPAVAACKELARNDLETIYCTIKAQGKGSALPDFYDFRKNQRSVQLMLLRRPARAAGLTLPTQKPEKFNTEKARPAANANIDSDSNSKPKLKSKVALESAAESEEDLVPDNVSLLSCDLRGREILCGKDRFVLLQNKSNRLLAPNVLSASNQLNLPHQRSDESLMPYLSRAYQRYIVKMLEIGLASVTMSYSRFFYTHQSQQEQAVDFVGRMETMYSFLKKDRQQMSVSGSAHKTLPKNLRQCMRLSALLIVCDDARNNWIYQRIK